MFLMKEVDKRDGKMIVAHYLPLYMGSFGCCALDSRVSVMFIVMLRTPIARLFNVADMCK